jgi:hypothetical protein
MEPLKSELRPFLRAQHEVLAWHSGSEFLYPQKGVQPEEV